MTALDPNTHSLLQFLVSTSFTLGFMAMAGGALYFALLKDQVLSPYRSTMVVSSVILFIAALNYYYMTSLYADSILSGIDSFPTNYRYIDWILTTPLMLAKFPLLLGLGGNGRQFMYRLIGLDLIMILSGFFGEILIDQPVLHYGLFGVGMVCWVIIAYLLISATRNLPDRFPQVVKKCVAGMTLFVVVGWAIYPLGYILPSFGLPQDVRELVYNVGDIVNKVGLALVVYAAAAALTKQAAENEAMEA